VFLLKLGRKRTEEFPVQDIRRRSTGGKRLCYHGEIGRTVMQLRQKCFRDRRETGMDKEKGFLKVLLFERRVDSLNCQLRRVGRFCNKRVSRASSPRRHQRSSKAPSKKREACYREGQRSIRGRKRGLSPQKFSIVFARVREKERGEEIPLLTTRILGKKAEGPSRVREK